MSEDNLNHESYVTIFGCNLKCPFLLYISFKNHEKSKKIIISRCTKIKHPTQIFGNYI